MRPTLNRFALPLILPLILALGLCPFHLHAAEYDEALKAISSDLAQCFDQHQRVKVAAVDFTDLQLNTSELGRLIAEELSTELVRSTGERPGGFTVLDRNHLQLILREHQLEVSGLVDPANAKKLGKFAGIDTLVSGNIFELEQTIRVTVKAMDTETAAIVCAARGDMEKTMALREIAAMSTGSSVRSQVAGENEGGAGDADGGDGPVEAVNASFRVRARSLVKNHDGSRFVVVLGITNLTGNRLYLSIGVDAPPDLIDNSGTIWSFVSCSGIDMETADFHALVRSARPDTLFESGVERPVTCKFSSSGSPGSRFDLTVSFRAQQAPDGGHRSSMELISAGLTGLRTR